MKTAKKIIDRTARKRRVRARISGTAARPRLAVFRSTTAIYAQIIDDESGKTLAAASSLKIKKGRKWKKPRRSGNWSPTPRSPRKLKKSSSIAADFCIPVA